MSNNMMTSLAGNWMFNSLTSSDQQRLASLLRTKSFGSDETIFTKGDQGEGLYIIRSGRIKICADDFQGNELIFTFLSSGDLLGEIAVLDGLPRSATAIAVTPTNTYYLDRKKFLEFLKISPQSCIAIITYLCTSLRRLSTQLEEVSFLSVSGRIARFLISMPTKEGVPSTCAISQEELANTVGASRVIVNKILKSFAELGFISVARKKITVINELELNRIGNYNLSQ